MMRPALRPRSGLARPSAGTARGRRDLASYSSSIAIARTTRGRQQQQRPRAVATGDHDQPPSLFIFGMGYTGRELARQAAAKGWRVCGTTTAAAPAPAASGGDSTTTTTTADDDHPQIQVVQFAPRRDGSDRARARESGGESSGSSTSLADALLTPAGRAALASATHVLSSIPPVAAPLYDPVLAAQLDLLRWRVTMATAGHDDQCPPPLRWVGYLGSTGVYGDRGGGWVDEGDAPSPCSARGVVRLEHERAWERALGEMAEEAEVEAAPAFRVFRLGGIYGPGRSVLEPLLAEAWGTRRRASTEDAQASSPPPPSQRERRRRQRFTSRVHVADAARAALASAALAGGGTGNGNSDGFPPLPARVYNVVDDLPAPRSEVEAYALERLREAGVGVEVGRRGAGTRRREAAAVVATAAAASNSDASSEQAPPPPLEEKRVRNNRLKAELLGGGELLYPTYRPAIDELVLAYCKERR